MTSLRGIFFTITCGKILIVWGYNLVGYNNFWYIYIIHLSNYTYLFMKENNLFVLFITMIFLDVSCYTHSIFGNPAMNKGAPNWFHNVSNYHEVIEY